jgi:hypothetical protein
MRGVAVPQKEGRGDHRAPLATRLFLDDAPRDKEGDPVIPESPPYGMTSNRAIIAASSCSRMWQWSMNCPTLSVNFIFTTIVSPMPRFHDPTPARRPPVDGSDDDELRLLEV